MTSAELRRRLDAAGYDLAAVDQLSGELKVDLVAILAGWTPTLVELMSTPPTLVRRLPWWRRLWRRST